MLASKDEAAVIAYINLKNNSIISPVKLQEIIASNYRFKKIPIHDIREIMLLSKSWPRDIEFNKNIINVFFSDANNNMYHINDSDFSNTISAIIS